MISLVDQFRGFCSTPSIFPQNKNLSVRSFSFPDVEINSAIVNDLENIVHPRNSVLGKRMESFFEIAIKHSERYDLIDSNIQIIENKQTLGEIDFLLYDKLKACPLHVELVYKLYVYDEQLSPEINRWIGPNRKDSFSEKLEKLKNKQFPILYKPETLTYLEKLGLAPQDIEQRLCFKAKLFTASDLPIQKDENNIINSDCFSGELYRFSEFEKFNWQQNLFFSPQKKYWSASPATNPEWLDYNDIVKNIKSLFERQRAPLIWMKTKTGYKSFFVVWW
ncbi:DUF1853 family protein [Gramella sp. KN1008]|uniref:DUF1853 family protein n=1 Tax=Gramella sp. KN1008 TaxID=2529298 RepID=UPI00103F2FBB|nr:DUF1853 family protein [Gramella sp. KN1008]TBW29299.1 DUF1853 family protein [Gramella sp. KN1008]